MAVDQTTTIEVTTAVPAASMLPCGSPFPPASEGRKAMSLLSGALDAISGGELPASVTVQVGGTAAAQASGTLTLSSASGAVGGVINGVTITATAAGGDTATAALIAAAINASANALVAGIVTATASGAVVTIRSVDATKAANAITLVASGTGVTASGARLTGGAGHDVAGVTYNLR
jgi:phage tail sheath gpL-like